MMKINKYKTTSVSILFAMSLGMSMSVHALGHAKVAQVSGYDIQLEGNIGHLNNDRTLSFAVPKNARGIRKVIKSTNGQKIVIFNNGMGSLVGQHMIFKMPDLGDAQPVDSNDLNVSFSIQPILEYLGGYAEQGAPTNWKYQTYHPYLLYTDCHNVYAGWANGWYQCEDNEDDDAGFGGNVFITLETNSNHNINLEPLSYWPEYQTLSAGNSGGSGWSLSAPPLENVYYYPAHSYNFQVFGQMLASDLNNLTFGGQTQIRHLHFQIPTSLSIPIGYSPVSSNTDVSSSTPSTPTSLSSGEVLSPYYMTYQFMEVDGPYQKWYQGCVNQYQKQDANNPQQASQDIQKYCAYTNMPRADNGNDYQGIGPIHLQVKSYDQFGNLITFNTQFEVDILPSQLSVVNVPEGGN